MLKKYNKNLTFAGSKLRAQIIFDILENINYHNFFKNRFFKDKYIRDKILKFI